MRYFLLLTSLAILLLFASCFETVTKQEFQRPLSAQKAQDSVLYTSDQLVEVELVVQANALVPQDVVIGETPQMKKKWKMVTVMVCRDTSLKFPALVLVGQSIDAPFEAQLEYVETKNWKGILPVQLGEVTPVRRHKKPFERTNLERLDNSAPVDGY